MMARLYSGCHDVISIRNGYHGNAAGTMGATAQGSYKFNVVQVYIHFDCLQYFVLELFELPNQVTIIGYGKSIDFWFYITNFEDLIIDQ